MEGTLELASDRAAVGVVLASEGYPDAPLTGRELRGAEPTAADDGGPRLCFHAGTRAEAAGTMTAGGRVATFVGLAGDHAAARAQAYGSLAEASLEGGQHRTDIAAEVA
jgi:phosphoribosylamine--glycine ligase